MAPGREEKNLCLWSINLLLFQSKISSNHAMFMRYMYMYVTILFHLIIMTVWITFRKLYHKTIFFFTLKRWFQSTELFLKVAFRLSFFFFKTKLFDTGIIWRLLSSPFLLISVVFMGSKKYPQENKLDDFLGKHGGYTNAWTDCERVILKRFLLISL